MDNQHDSVQPGSSAPEAPETHEAPTSPPETTSSTGTTSSVVTSDPQPTPPHKSRKLPLLFILLPLVVVLLAGAAAFGGYTMSNSKATKDKAALNNQLAVLQSNTHELPAGAIKVSECIPNMGSHYVTKDADPEYGPFYLVTKSGKVIGMEYMASLDMYTKIPNADPPVDLITKASPLYGWKFDHTEFTHLSKGHEGLEREHIDVHYFTVTPEQQKKACI